MVTKIIIVDDHKMMMEGLKNLLKSEDSISVIETTSSEKRCISLLKENQANLLLLDISMPQKSGFDILEEIRKLEIDVKVIMLTAHTEVEYLVRAIELGANGYILKNAEFMELVHAIRMVMNGETYIQSEMISILDSKMTAKKNDKEKIKNLTKRELEVLILVSEGMFNKEIADRLHISERTVKNHISSIFKKIDVADRTQAAVFAIRNRLIPIW